MAAGHNVLLYVAAALDCREAATEIRRLRAELAAVATGGAAKPEPVDLTIRPEDLAAALAASQNPCTHYTAQMERDCRVCQKWRDEHPGAMP